MDNVISPEANPKQFVEHCTKAMANIQSALKYAQTKKQRVELRNIEDELNSVAGDALPKVKV